MFQEPTSSATQTSGPAESSPKSTERVIFRAEAYHHYVQNQEKIELPRTVTPRALLYLWIVAGILAILGFAVAFWPLLSETPLVLS